MINCTLYGLGDETFSYKIYKNPASSPFDIKTGVTAFFVDDYTFNISIEKGSLLDIENLSDLQTWNVESLFAFSTTSLTTVFNDTLRSAMRKQADGIEYLPHRYEMVFVPCVIDSKLEKIAELCDITVMFGVENRVLFKSNKYILTEFLQRVFISMFINYGGYRYANKEQIAMFVKFVASWNSENETQICEMLTGRRIGLIAAVNENGVELEKRETLHDWKHKVIGEFLKNPIVADKQIVELGCGTGQFARKAKIDPSRYIGVEQDSYKVRKAKEKSRKHKFVTGDITLLDSDIIARMDIALLLEVVEHFEPDALDEFVKTINNVYKPQYIVITTPNMSANALYGFEGFRHPDHKFEFDEEEYMEFIGSFDQYVSLGDYAIDTKEHSGMEIAPSFVSILSRKGDAVSDEKIVASYYKKLKEAGVEYGKMLSPIQLPQISYTFESKQIQAGMNSNHFKRTTPFYLGASIAPSDVKDAYREIKYYVDHPEYLSVQDINDIKDISSEMKAYVEHPQYALDYYRSKGYLGNCIFQVKEMGSRANVLAFKNIETAKKYGYTDLVTITSRRGYRFFRDDEENAKYCALAHAEIFRYDHNYSVLMLDCEITPWQYLAEGLIEKEFSTPVTLQLNGGLYDRYIKSLAGIESTFDEAGCVSFLDSLKHFTPDEEPKCNVFDILLLISDNGKDVQNGLQIPYERKLIIMRSFYNAKNIFVDTVAYSLDMDEIWRYAIDNKKEGVVVKPNLPFLPNGKLLQPAIKARTPMFLRLIYGGPNYDEYSHLIMNRNVKAKRYVGIRESALSNMMVEAFIRNDKLSQQRAAAAFFGINTKTDGTL